MQLPQLGVRAEALRNAPYVLVAERVVMLVSGKPMSDVDAIVANVVAKREGIFLFVSFLDRMDNYLLTNLRIVTRARAF